MSLSGCPNRISVSIGIMFVNMFLRPRGELYEQFQTNGDTVGIGISSVNCW
jgi:hypothetical protein